MQARVYPRFSVDTMYLEVSYICDVNCPHVRPFYSLAAFIASLKGLKAHFSIGHFIRITSRPFNLQW